MYSLGIMDIAREPDGTPDCNYAAVRAEFPALCAQSPELRRRTCQKYPVLCQITERPSMAEPIIGTIEDLLRLPGKVAEKAEEKANFLIIAAVILGGAVLVSQLRR